MGHYVIFLFTAPTTKWPWEKSGNLFKKKIWNHMTGRKKLEIGSIFPYFVPPAGTPPSLFRLFANATHKINHARRNFTFTCKITPRVNFYMFRTLIAWLFHVMKNYPKSLQELTRRKSWEKVGIVQSPSALSKLLLIFFFTFLNPVSIYLWSVYLMYDKNLPHSR